MPDARERGRLRTKKGLLRAKYAELAGRAENLRGCLGRDLELTRVKDLVARRFILTRDWVKYLESLPEGAQVDPAQVYDPKPVTWDNWWKTAKDVEERAASGLSLDVPTLAKWNGKALRGTVDPAAEKQIGMLKKYSNYGENVSRADALAKEEIADLAAIEVGGKPILKWTALECEEDLPAAKAFDPSRNAECAQLLKQSEILAGAGSPSSEFWKSSLEGLRAGRLKNPATGFREWYWFACWPRARAQAERSCGMVKYSDPKEAPGLLGRVLKDVEEFFAKGGHSEFETVRFALETQRKVVAIHPFPDGNGRVSRWVMDYIVARAGIPPLLIAEMNRDLAMTSRAYVDHGFRGAWDGLAIMTGCLKTYEKACSAPKAQRAELLASVERSKCGTLE